MISDKSYWIKLTYNRSCKSFFVFGQFSKVKLSTDPAIGVFGVSGVFENIHKILHVDDNQQIKLGSQKKNLAINSRIGTPVRIEEREKVVQQVPPTHTLSHFLLHYWRDLGNKPYN